MEETEFATFKEWMLDRFDRDQMADLSQYGAKGGFSGLTYYRDTQALYDKYKREIWAMLREDANNAGYNNALEYVAIFGAADGADDAISFENLLVWYAAERIAYDAVELGWCKDDEDEEDSDSGEDQ